MLVNEIYLDYLQQYSSLNGNIIRNVIFIPVVSQIKYFSGLQQPKI